MGSNSASNKLGVYGLLNEFAAYSWGLDTTVRLFPYFREHAETYDDWYRFIVEGENDRNAYAEFLYWTLNYLEFARAYHRDVYDKIILAHQTNPKMDARDLDCVIKACIARGEIYAAQKKVDKAKECYQKATTIDTAKRYTAKISECMENLNKMSN